MINDTKGRRRNGIFSRLFRLRRSSPESAAATTTNIPRKNNHLDKNYADETDDESFTSSSSSSSSHIIDSSSIAADTGYPGTATYDNIPGSSSSSIQSCLKLLSSEDIDRNRVGLQRLATLTKHKGRRRLSGPYRSKEIAPHVLVFGGPPGSIEEQLRYSFSTMICDNPHKYQTTPMLPTDPNDEKEALFDWILDYDPITGLDGNGNHVTYYDDDDDDDDDDDGLDGVDDEGNGNDTDNDDLVPSPAIASASPTTVGEPTRTPWRPLVTNAPVLRSTTTGTIFSSAESKRAPVSEFDVGMDDAFLYETEDEVPDAVDVDVDVVATVAIVSGASGHGVYSRRSCCCLATVLSLVATALV